MVDPIIIDSRSSKLSKNLLSLDQVAYVFFNSNIYNYCIEKIETESDKYLITDLKEAKEFKVERPIVFVDCPPTLELFNSAYSGNEDQIIYACFYSKKEVYLNGFPKRNDFTRLYKFLATHKSIDLRLKGKELAKHLNFDIQALKFMIKVFIDAGFVKMDKDELIFISDNSEKKELENTETFLKRRELMQAEETLLFSSFKELSNTLKTLSKNNES